VKRFEWKHPARYGLFAPWQSSHRSSQEERREEEAAIMKKLFGIVIIAVISISVQARGFHGFHSYGHHDSGLPNDDPPGTPYHFWPRSFYVWQGETNSVVTNGMTINQVAQINEGYSAKGITFFCFIGFVVFCFIMLISILRKIPS
jgi:hypothetical protein